MVGGDLCDLVNNLHTGYDLAECCILTVKVGGILVHDKELGGGRVGVIRPSHRDYAALVLDGVCPTVCTEFALDVFLCAAHAIALGIAALDHKALDNSVENKAVVKALLYELFKILYGDGCCLGIKLELDHTAVLHFDYYHFFSPFVIYFGIVG